MFIPVSLDSRTIVPSAFLKFLNINIDRFKLIVYICHMYVNRILKDVVDQARRTFPAVLITGPRQSGKTTFLKEEYGKKSHYISFDDPLEKQFASEDPNAFLNRFVDRPVILDEIQYVPQFFTWLKMRIDSDRTLGGRFLVTGSQQFQIMKNVSDSLAGRIAVFDLLPFYSDEYFAVHPDHKIQEMIWYGGYPEIILHPEQRNLWISSYIRTYVERDIRQLQNIRDIGQFEQFIGLLAARHGQELNLSDLSRSIGLSVPGCRQWLHILDASYMIYQLRPFYQNFGKRIIKAPKIYFIDSAIAAYFSRQSSPEGLWYGSMGGQFFEGWIVLDTLKRLIALGQPTELYFWRSHDGLEVDLILVLNGRFYPVEIKQTATPMPRHTSSLTAFRRVAGEFCEPGILVCTVDEIKSLPGGTTALPWKVFGSWIESIVSGKAVKE
jgi:predicted AAA+ superfamily ATPase